ncbi:FAD-binding oxidoreductase [Roseimicrobium sp. ORNL1]|uniref:NAD(P)/FAD-dependent oxidoreductase n=1 Tax=Roseimicrobium sp. ORNL1 TaxID=2711231 RepID=UPI0013E1500F|nr:FAD-binding oxidoreductase [Roseimicrobium sp. ORNL1]QIF05845.1 FAD-binding oxidoreductase [Roseimicrobium sp. ORNL1]
MSPASPSSLPVLIVGGGLAGTAVAWQCWARSVPFLVVDPGEAETTSRVAAGLVTPITGQRLKVSWRLEELLPEARAFYQRMEEQVGGTFYHPSPMVRLFSNERELKFWGLRREEADIQRWADTTSPDASVDASVFHNELGGFGQPDAAWLDTVTYLAASKEFFSAKGCWHTGAFKDDELDVSQEAVKWQGNVYAAVVLCRGAEERHDSRFFPWLQWDCARGVIADVRADYREHRMVQRGGWMQPRGDDGIYRAGSTYEFDFTRSLEESTEELRGKLQVLLKVPFEILSSQTGIRPIVKRQQLIVGRHPVHERVLILNGLGSKGVLRAPFFSRMLVEHVLDGAPIEAEVDVRANG